MITETVVKIVVDAGEAGGKKVVGLIRKKAEWRSEYDLPKEVVSLLYY